MFGSDWPVALQAGSYKDVVDLFEQLLPDQWGVTERKKVRMANALAFYFGTEEEKA
jgi:L-fuconolactonase